MPAASKQSLLARLLLEIRAAEKVMAQRIDEAMAIEARLIRRMDLMADAEKNLKTMMQSVQREVEEARPLFKPLPEIKAAAQESLKKAMAAVEGGVEKAMTRALHLARKTVEGHAESLVNDLDLAAKAFGSELATEMEAAQKSANELAGTLHRRLESAKKSASELDGVLDQQLESAQKSADELAVVLDQRLEAAREQYGVMEVAVEERLRHITGQMYKRLDEQKQAAAEAATAPAPTKPSAPPPIVLFPKREVSKLDEAAAKLAGHRERVNKLPLISSPRKLGRIPEFLRCGERRWRGQLVGDSIIEMSSRAA